MLSQVYLVQEKLTIISYNKVNKTPGVKVLKLNNSLIKLQKCDTPSFSSYLKSFCTKIRKSFSISLTVTIRQIFRPTFVSEQFNLVLLYVG